MVHYGSGTVFASLTSRKEGTLFWERSIGLLAFSQHRSLILRSLLNLISRLVLYLLTPLLFSVVTRIILTSFRISLLTALHIFFGTVVAVRSKGSERHRRRGQQKPHIRRPQAFTSAEGRHQSPL